MIGLLKEPYNSRFKIIVFILLPILLVISCIISVKLVEIISGQTINRDGIIFACVVTFLLYCYGVFRIYRILQNKSQKK